MEKYSLNTLMTPRICLYSPLISAIGEIGSNLPIMNLQMDIYGKVYKN
jgi:hypothetical protein